jgi:VanZ family protein
VLAALVADASRWRWPAIVAAVALFGLSLELVQFPLPTRAFSLVDATANTVGAAVGVAAHRLARVARSTAA